MRHNFLVAGCACLPSEPGRSCEAARLLLSWPYPWEAKACCACLPDLGARLQCLWGLGTQLGVLRDPVRRTRTFWLLSTR